MPYREGGREDVTSGAGLLISILARYPEVVTVNYDPAGRVLNFTFLSSRVLSAEESGELKKRLREGIAAFNFLACREIRVGAVFCREYDQMTIIEAQRDVDTLVSEEIALIVSLVRDFLGGYLLTERSNNCPEDDLVLQEEIIAHLLEDVRGANEKSYLVAFRKEDRVLVFNK